MSIDKVAFFKRPVFLVLIFISLTSISSGSFAVVSKSELFLIISLRLAYMEEVALYKSVNAEPIEDLEREALILHEASVYAEKEGLQKDSVVRFFNAQIAVSKALQYRYMASLQINPSRKAPKSLDTAIRPALINLGRDMISKLAEYLRGGGIFLYSDYEGFDAMLSSSYLTAADKELLFDSLSNVRLQ